MKPVDIFATGHGDVGYINKKGYLICMDKSNALVVFQDKKIRRIWHNDEWYFSVIDTISALETSTIPKRYWSDLKAKLSTEGFEPYDFIVQLKLIAEDGKVLESGQEKIK